jgi:hypothetical protein
MNKKRFIAIFFSFIFVFGSIGFSFTIHTCSHSGVSYFSLLNLNDHPCDGERIKANSESCCSINTEKSCCSEVIVPDDSTDDENQPSCCKDELRFFKIDDLFFSVSVKKTTPFFTLIFSYLNIESFLKLDFKKAKFSFLPLRISPYNLLSVLCVFKI